MKDPVYIYIYMCVCVCVCVCVCMCVCVCVCKRRILHVERKSVKCDIHHRYSVSFEACWECHCDVENSTLNIKTTETRKFTSANDTNAGTAGGRSNEPTFLFFWGGGHVWYFLISFVISQATMWMSTTNFHQNRNQHAVIKTTQDPITPITVSRWTSISWMKTMDSIVISSFKNGINFTSSTRQIRLR